MKTQVTPAEAPQTYVRRFMEHRWGTRVELGHSVLLEMDGQPLALGRMLNASISGALIATPATMPALTAVKVRFPPVAGASAQEFALDACVVRTETGAVAVEWRDMACENLVRLLHAQDARAQLWARDRAFD